MSSVHLLTRLAGEASLLLWGVHMVQSGLQRAYGPELQAGLRIGLRDQASACLAGLGITLALQSSLATAMMTGSFVADGVMPLTIALAVMLGANVGSALIVKAFAFDTSLIVSIALVCGLVAFRQGGMRVRNVGRAMIGLGLMLLALHMLVDSVVPTGGTGAGERIVLAQVTGDPAILLFLAGLVTVAAHSSVAAVLVIMSLAGTGFIASPAALAMVLGANLGSALNPVLAFARAHPGGLRLALGNLLTRLVGCIIVLPILPRLVVWLGKVDPAPRQLVANFHIAFNLMTALLFLVALPLVGAMLKWLIPDRSPGRDPGMPKHLDPAALHVPAVALANATRESLRMTEIANTMLHGVQAMLHANDRQRASVVRRIDDQLDSLHGAIELYLANLATQELSDAERRRLSWVLTFAVNLEHAGDVIERSLTALVAKKIKGGHDFPSEVMAEIDEMFARLGAELRLAATVLLNEDPESARLLFEAKDAFRSIEQRSRERYVARMCAGQIGEIGAGALIADIMRDLRRISSHFAAIAQPVLTAHDLLRVSRLVAAK